MATSIESSGARPTTESMDAVEALFHNCSRVENAYCIRRMAVIHVHQLLTVNVSNYPIGPNMWPQASRNPFYNINAFAYPAAFTEGNAGS